jgi:hypothetical protein
MLANALLALWGIETLAALVVGFRNLHKFPVTSVLLIARSALYVAMAGDWMVWGYANYRMGHLASAWVFRAVTVLMCLESVWLMAQGIPQIRYFAAVTSLLFAAAGITFAAACSELLRGSWIDMALGSNVQQYRNLAIACMLYLVANHWLYERARPTGPLATQHWRAVVVLVAGMMFGYGIEDWGARHRVMYVVVAGQFIVRGGSLGALWIWGSERKGKR